MEYPKNRENDYFEPNLFHTKPPCPRIGGFVLTILSDAAIIIRHPGVAQLVARMVRDHEAVGSNPATRTKKEESFKTFLFFLSCAVIEKD